MGVHDREEERRRERQQECIRILADLQQQYTHQMTSPGTVGLIHADPNHSLHQASNGSGPMPNQSNSSLYLPLISNPYMRGNLMRKIIKKNNIADGSITQKRIKASHGSFIMASQAAKDDLAGSSEVDSKKVDSQYEA